MRIERYAFAIIMVGVMVFIAEFTNEKEIIFPEIVALTIGAWISAKQPWMSNKRKMFALISLAALMGVCTVRYVAAPLIFQVGLCFAFTGLALTITKTTLIPIISACILPVYLQTTSWVYPISVAIMSAIIIAAQWLMEKEGLRYKNHYEPCVFDFKDEFKKWSKLLILLMIISLIPVQSRNLYFIAPPLIVAFTEFANVNSKLRKKALPIFLIILTAAFVGMGIRVVLNMYLHVPLVFCAIVACLFLFVTFEFSQVLFPPAGAILLLPMILRYEDLKYYPFEVAIGAAIFITAAFFFFKSRNA